MNETDCDFLMSVVVQLRNPGNRRSEGAHEVVAVESGLASEYADRIEGIVTAAKFYAEPPPTISEEVRDGDGEDESGGC